MVQEKTLIERIADGMLATLRRLYALLMACLGIGVRPRPPALADRAECLVDQVEKAPARTDTVVKMLSPSLGIRTRQSAEVMSRGQKVPPAWLDPAKPVEKRILDWLERNKLDALSAIASARPIPLEAHVRGTRALPGLPPMEVAPKSVPFTVDQWIEWLTSRKTSSGDDGFTPDDVDKIERQAEALADRRLSPTDLEWQASRA
jgi:hypothetical protein